jgi:hypothetical protein
MAETEHQMKMRLLAEYFRNGGRAGLTPHDFNPQPQLSRGELSAAPPENLPPVQNVPVGALHDVSAVEGGGGVGTMDQMAALRAAQMRQNALAAQPPQEEFDPSGFTDVPKSRFGGLKAKLNGDEDENDEDQASNNNNRAGTAEGSYGDNK